MKPLPLFMLLLLASAPAWPDTHYPGLHVSSSREGKIYHFQASFDTPLNTCAAYRYLTDYAAAMQLPGMLESATLREAANRVRVDRTAEEQVLFFHVRMHSSMEYIEIPYSGIDFRQIAGDSRRFQGTWRVVANGNGSTFRFDGEWEPDTVIPLFVIDHFAANGLLDRFDAIAGLALQRKDLPVDGCMPAATTGLAAAAPAGLTASVAGR